MKYSNTVEYNIKTSLDSKGLTQLRSELQSLELKLQNMGNKGLLDEKTFVDARNQIQGLGQALSDAFNPSLGMLDLSKLNQELKNNDVTAQGLKTAFTSLGAEGQVAFNNLVGELGKLDTGILRTNSQIDKLFTTFSNTFRWGLVSSFFSQFMNAIHSSVDYVKELDDSLTQIMLVTDYNRDSMNEFAKSANEAAKAVSMTTTGMTNASLIFAQQGYDLGQSQELATLSAKVANASQQDTATTSDQITAYMNAYGLENSIGELTQAMDNWALIANISAADVGELAQASQRAASMANAVGVSGEQLASQIATIESVTREAPEQIGNGLKTLYARFSDIASGKEDEDGFTLGKVTSELNKIGVQVLDEMGQIRDVGDIIEDLMVIWDDLDQTSKVAASQALAGKYQVNRFMALMDNSDMYEEYKGATGANAAGTLDMMNEEYAQSIEGRSAKLQASLEGLFSTIFNTDDIYPWMDAAQGAVDLLQQFFDALGGGQTVLLGISSLLMQIFSKNMAQEINNAATNKAVQQQKLENLQNSQAALTTLGAANPNPNDANSQNILNFAQYMQANAKNFNAEQMDQANSILQELVQNSNAATMAADKLKESLSVIGTGITATTGESILAPFLDGEGAVNATLLFEALQNMSQSEITDMFSHIQDDIKSAREGLLEFNQALQGYQQELRNTNSNEDTWTKKVQILENALYNLEGKIDSNTYQRYVEAVSDIVSVTDDAGNKTAETTAEVAKLADGLEKVAAKDLTNLDQLNKDAFQAKNTQMAAEDSNKVAGAFQGGMGSQAQIQNILNTMNAVQQLTFAWQAFQNLGSIWANEDLSKGEKILQIIMNLTMAMPQLISAMESLKNTELFSVLGQGITGIQQAFQSAVNKTDFGKGIIDAKEQLEELTIASEKGKAALEKIGQTSSLDDLTDDLIKAVKEGEIADAALATIGPTLETSATAGAGALGVLKGGLAAVGAAAKAALIEFWPFLLIGGVIAAIGFAIGQEAEKAKKAKEEALEAFDEAQSKLEEIQNLESQTESFRTKFETMKSEGKGFDGLTEDAEAFADALEKAGMATESSTIRAAAYRAEVNGTAKDFEILAQEMEKAQKAAEVQANNDNIEAAIEVLNTQKADFNEIINKQAELVEQKRQLNELEADDPGRKIIQDKIDALQDYIGKNKEAVDAVNAVRASQEAIAGMKADTTQGPQQVASLGLDDATVRAGTEAKYEGTRDTATLNRLFGEEVQGWDSGLYTDLEKIDVMLNNVENDADRTSLKISEMLMTSQGLTDFEGHMEFGRDKDQYIAGSNDYEAVMQQAGWTQDQALKFVASLDEPVSLEEFKRQVADLNNQITNDTDLDVLLDARLSDESKEGLVKDQIATYQPKDEDVDSEKFQNLSNHFFENEDKMGVEGTPFEDYSEDLLGNAEALEEVVEGILRFNDAVESIDSNYDDWKQALSDTDDLAGQAEAIDDLQETYSDFLDLSEDMDVSEDFAANAENLDLMKAAAEGVEGAYEDLAMAAAEDILIHADVEDLDGAKAALEGLSSELPALFEGVDIGGALDLSSVEQQINDLAKATGWSADQMAAYLNSIGIKINPDQFQPLADSANATADAIGQAAQDAADNASMDVEANQVTNVNTSTDEKQFTDAYPHVNPQGAQWSIDLPTFSGSLANGVTPSTNKVTGWVPEITYTASPKSAKETKTDTSQATGYKYTAGKGATGKVQLKPNATATRSGGGSRPSGGAKSSGGGGGGGGSCFVAGTLISTSFGYKPIELIKSNDFVLSYNESLHQNEYSKVIQTMIHDTVEPIYTLYIKNEQLRVTGIHRLLVSKDISFGPQWIAAQDLQIGDWVLLADNTWHLIWKIEVNLEHQIVYNFEVAGNHNYYVGRNQILAHNKGGGGKKGGGGSGSGQKAKTAKKKEAEKAEKKYYEEVDKQLEQTKETLDSLEKVTDKLTGTQARAKQNEQLKMLQKEKDLQEKKLKILQEQEKVDVSTAIKKADKDFEDLLKKQGVNFNLLDFTFDEEGFINNLDPVRESIANGINKLNDQYNAIIGDDGEVTDEEQERLKALDEEIQKLEKLGKEVEKNGTRYNEIVLEEQKIQDEMQEIQDQMQDIAIDAYKASQEAIDNLKDLRKEWAKFSAGLYDSSKGESFLSLDNPIRQLKEIENEISSIYAVSGTEARKYYDDIIAQQQKYLENAKTADEQQAYKDAIEYYEKLRDSIDDGAVLNNGLMQLALNDLTRLQEIWNNWNDEGGNGFFGDDKAALEKALEDAQKRVMEFAQDFEELIEDLKDASLDVVDHTMEQWDRQLDRYDRVIDQLDRYSDTYSLIYGDASYNMQEAVLSQQAQTLKSELDAAQEAYLAANTYYLEAYEKFVDKSTGLAKEGYEDYMYELEEAMNDAEDKVRDIAADAAEKFSEAFEAAVMASTQYILRNTIGENDFEHSDRNWEWDKEYIDKYKDGVEKAYEMDKLRNRYIDMLNNAQGASLQTQNKIRAQMQEQLDLLDGQKTVSEYDVKLANAKLEILQKQIALEDAQRNKNKMQLRRDTQGNYRYVYTADKDNVDQAQQELLDSEYDAYEMSKQQQMNNYDDMINAYKRYLSQREEILTNNNLSEAQKMEQIKELWDRFQKYVSAAQEDFGDATAGTVDILQWLVVNGTDYTATAATDMLNQLLDAEGNVAEQSGVIWMDLANNMANEVIPSIADAVTTADDVIEQKLVQTGIALVGEDGTGGVFGEVSNGANNFGDQCEMAANQTAILAEQSNKLKEALLGDSGAFKQAQEELANYQKQLEDVTNASAITAQTLRATQQALDQAKAENLNYKTQIDRLLSGQDIIVDHKIVDAEQYRRQQEEEKRKQQQRNSGGGGGRNALADARAIWYHGAWGNGGDWYTPYSRQFGTAAANKVLWYFNHGYGYNFDFDTGGYTGEWNQGEGVSSHKNGKLAFLHQKELILNAQDTENILSAVSMVRSLANSAQASMNNINTAASSNINSIYNPVTEQRVDIQASFPNATDAEDIRQALIGLSDRAYQYAHRVI